MCTRTVAAKGGTCSLECYENFLAYLASGGGVIPPWMPVPLSMEANEWYEKIQKEIQVNAEAHNPNSPLLKGVRPLDT